MAEKDQVEKLEAAIEKIRAETFKPKQTLPQLRHAIALIRQNLKERPSGVEWDRIDTRAIPG